MALRVLLADESSTIKKVFQLALQDFAVDVRNVNVGTDVVTVAESFQPDIIFADVLLQKRSGYEVSAELKQNANLNQVPVVLMFSGFMDLDEDKFQASHATAQLEKPFEVQALRKLVTDLVPRTQTQRLSQFLTFPKMPEMEEAPPAAPEPKPAHGDEFKQVSIPKMRGQTPGADKYRVDLKPEELESSHVPVDFGGHDDAVDVEALLGADADGEEDQFAIRGPARSAARPPGNEIELESFADDADFKDLANAAHALPPPTPPSAPSAPRPSPAAPPPPQFTPPSLDAAELERIIRAQSADIIQDVVWKVIPDLAAQIIERELNKLLRERETNLR